jgi:hypothetical protein
MDVENASVQDIKRRAEMRDLVQTILDYGVNNQDIKNIIYFLSLELEEIDLAQQIPQLIKQFNNKSQKSGIITGE